MSALFMKNLLKAYLDIFTKNIYAIFDNAYKNLKRIINGPNIAVVSGDRESCIVIINHSDCFKKLQHMNDEGIQNGVYIVPEDRTLEDPKLFRSFLFRNFKECNYYEKMLPNPNQPEQLMKLLK